MGMDKVVFCLENHEKAFNISQGYGAPDRKLVLFLGADFTDILIFNLQF